MSTRKVLDVGQCHFDHSRISHYLKANFDVEIVQAQSFAESIKLAGESDYDLILINRLLDADHSPGMDILKKLKSDDSTSSVPVMIVSNFDDAQAAAVDEGAVPGFGKANLDSEATKELLDTYLR